MSGLRRSRPDEQDASLRRLREISATRLETDSSSTSKNPRSLTPCSFHTVQSFESLSQSSSDDEGGVHRISVPILKVSSHESDQFKSINKNDVGVLLQQQTTFLSTDLAPVSPRMKIKSQSLSSSSGIFFNERLMPSELGRSCTLSTNTPSSFQKNIKTSETELGSSANHTEVCKKPLSSPSSPSSVLKHLKVFSMSGFCSSKRRESEPILDSQRANRSKGPKDAVTDRHWEKLRSILVAMRDEPVHFDMPETNSVESYEMDGHNRLDFQEKLLCLQREVADLRVILRQKESDLIQLEKERDAAVKLACRLKSSVSINQKDTNMALEEYRDGLESLSDENVSKEDVVGVASQIFQELMSQRSYLEQLMTAVLTQAPHLLENVDGVHRTTGESLNDDDDSISSLCNESDDEVWC